ncbi:Protein CBG12830 [Caenorhabditis briggsae]|uniref:Tyrosine-protein kinase n=1 Tax=Caenorhabditis briggsae TaxID=6238 RepID=A8XFQ1_CAEBR|nr:Protein CBG12830 [Caenorhabditis briggsae]CAP31747.2 Protein CBG12830 [Caenorhabditis briggsae]
MARKETDANRESKELHSQDDADSARDEKERGVEAKTAKSPVKMRQNKGKNLQKGPAEKRRSMEAQEESRDKEAKTATAQKKDLKSPATPKIPSPNPSSNKGNKQSREKNESSADKLSGRGIRAKVFTEFLKRRRETRALSFLCVFRKCKNGYNSRWERPRKLKKPSCEADVKESSSSPPKTDAQKEVVKESSSTYGSSWHSARPQTTKKDFQTLEEHICKMPNFHGYICREDVTILLKNSGDWLVRLSVQPCKENEKKASKGAKSVERGSKARGSKNRSKDNNKVFVISVHSRKAVSPGKSSCRNLVIKTNDGKFSIDSIKWFMKVADFFSYYQGTVATYKESEFQLLHPCHLSVWEFHQDDIELMSKKLGEGAFGDVRVGRMTTKDPKKTVAVVDVAVKMLKNSLESITRDQVDELLHEARVMRRLDHPNVLRTYGVSVLREPLYLMNELCANGALREYLKENHKTITISDKLNFVLGAARGVAYLHSQRIIHRDLAVRNVFLTENMTPKVSDFGLAKLTDRYEMKEHCKIPVRYLAPETLELFVFTPKTDVFSFGCVIWEIFENGQQPHDGKNAQTIRAQIKNRNIDFLQVKKREFLKLSSSAPDSLRKYVAEKVFVPDPENRCSMTGIVQCVEKVEKSAK